MLMGHIEELPFLPCKIFFKFKRGAAGLIGELWLSIRKLKANRSPPIEKTGRIRIFW